VKQKSRRSVGGEAPAPCASFVVASARKTSPSLPDTDDDGQSAPGSRALEEVRLYQESTHLLIPRRPFSMLVREIAATFKADLHFQRVAIEALQEASEAYLVELLEESALLAYPASSNAQCHLSFAVFRVGGMRGG
jgi:histone H3